MISPWDLARSLLAIQPAAKGCTLALRAAGDETIPLLTFTGEAEAQAFHARVAGALAERLALALGVDTELRMIRETLIGRGIELGTEMVCRDVEGGDWETEVLGLGSWVPKRLRDVEEGEIVRLTRKGGGRCTCRDFGPGPVPVCPQHSNAPTVAEFSLFVRRAGKWKANANIGDLFGGVPSQLMDLYEQTLNRTRPPAPGPVDARLVRAHIKRLRPHGMHAGDVPLRALAEHTGIIVGVINEAMNHGQ